MAIGIIMSATCWMKAGIRHKGIRASKSISCSSSPAPAAGGNVYSCHGNRFVSQGSETHPFASVLSMTRDHFYGYVIVLATSGFIECLFSRMDDDTILDVSS